MGPVSGLVLFAVIWFLVLFVVLPLRLGPRATGARSSRERKPGRRPISTCGRRRG